MKRYFIDARSNLPVGLCGPVEVYEAAEVDAVLTAARVALEAIAKEIYCDGPSCLYCDDGEGHPFTNGAKQARQALAALRVR